MLQYSIVCYQGGVKGGGSGGGGKRHKNSLKSTRMRWVIDCAKRHEKLLLVRFYFTLRYAWVRG